MPKGVPIDLDVLHHVLWQRADRLGRLKVVQTDLAADLGVTKYTMSRVITRMIDENRIRRISKRGNNAGQFVISQPT